MVKVDAEVRHLTRALNANPFFRSLVAAADLARSDLSASATTLHALIKRFNGPTVPLDVAAQEFFGLSRDKAYQYAALNKLPVPAFRCTDSSKSPLLIHLEDLAALIDARRAKARSEWSKSQVEPWGWGGRSPA